MRSERPTERGISGALYPRGGNGATRVNGVREGGREEKWDHVGGAGPCTGRVDLATAKSIIGNSRILGGDKKKHGKEK